MIKSKRFIAFTIALVLFIVMTYTTQHPILEIAGAISAITGIYITGESIRKSN